MRYQNELWWKIADAIGLVGLLFFAIYYLTAFRFDVIFTDPARQVDFTLWRFIPTYILEHHRYPAVVTGDWEHTVFQYLPSAAVMMLPLSIPSQPTAFAIWLFIEASAFALVLWLTLQLSGARHCRAPWLIMIAAVLLSENSLGWDFRNHNTNIVYLALVMLGLYARKTWVGSLMFALSINLKLYSGLVPMALAWRHEYQLAFKTCVLAVAIAILLPVVVFGPSAFPQVMTDWIAQIRYSMAAHSGETASLIRSVSTLLAVDPGASPVTFTLYAVQAVWLILIVCYYLLAARIQPSITIQLKQARLADVCVALVAPLPLSIWFIPYHAVVTLPAYMLLLVVASSNDWPKWLRVSSGSACVASLVVRFALPDWNYRGAMFLVTFVILLLALGAVRRELPRLMPLQV
jgi:hypothetical protein